MINIKVLKNQKHTEIVIPTLQKIDRENIVERIWNHDYTVWKSDPTEITNRLGWLRIADEMAPRIVEIAELVEEVRSNHYTNVVLLGMGGSSLAADVFQRVFRKREGYLKLSVLDSTDPDAVLRCLRNNDLLKTLFIVATKSGGTAETLSFFKFFYNEYIRMVDDINAGQHFVAITDPGSKLAVMAESLHFRRIFLNNANIGGRFSVLSYFGMVPAALMGIDIHKILASAQKMMEKSSPDLDSDDNPALALGGVLGSFAVNNIDKATFISSKSIAPFGDWVEQLIAESTGKDGKGILPVVDEPVGSISEYSKDRIFIVQGLRSDAECDDICAELAGAGFPVIEITLDDIYDFGGLFFLWEMATSIAGHCLGIQPFNQPNVELAKRLAREAIDNYIRTGVLEKANYTTPSADALSHFLNGVKQGDYVAVHAYMAPSTEVDDALTNLQVYIRNRFCVPVTKGYGPRFLHSTGQLHKGDAGRGIFIQLISENDADLAIPDEPGSSKTSMTFGVLKKAQALGDYKALNDVNRRVISFSVRDNGPGEILSLYKG
jgi:glucose-6-phosphate isomerase